MIEGGEMTVLVNDIPESIKQAFTYPREKQRLLWYTDKIPKQKWQSIYYVTDPERISYSECWVTAKMGQVLYPMKTSRKGFTFDRKTKKIKMWYGSNLNEMSHLSQFLMKLKLEWVVNEGFNGWLTKSLLEKILSGKVTCPKEATKQIMKLNRLSVDVEPLRKYIKQGSGRSGKHILLLAKDAVTNLQPVLENSYVDGMKADIIKQAKALGRKFDWAWSDRRLNEVHTEWTREIMKAELDLFEDESVDWDIDVPAGFEVITSKKRLFEEGSIMSHCVYTNYWERVRSKQYLVLRVTDEDGHIATAGIRTGDNPSIDQIKTYRNGEPTKKIEAMCEALMKDKTFTKQLKVVPQFTELASYPF